MSARLLLVDNKDSFTYNLAHLFGTLGADVRVLRNDDDRLSPGAVRDSAAVVIGPGPGRPEGAGKTFSTIGWAIDARRPLFGVCLGAQAIGEYFGGEIYHTPRLMHGKTSHIEHDATGVFAGMPSPFTATRYHSLCLARRRLPGVLRPNAFSEDGVIQGIAHRDLPIHAVQFHPESVLTVEGSKVFANFLAVV